MIVRSVIFDIYLIRDNLRLLHVRERILHTEYVRGADVQLRYKVRGKYGTKMERG